TKRCCGRSFLATLREVCHVANAPRNDGGEGTHKEGDPLTQGAGVGHPERDDKKRGRNDGGSATGNGFGCGG
ncbi:MAG: hypothetical protein NC218_10460, partial [Acetobacter sp.]|nr:hypothetical protein [Acetobacter sp.]